YKDESLIEELDDLVGDLLFDDTAKKMGSKNNRDIDIELHNEENLIVDIENAVNELENILL
ncbi:6953_t:CDS:1, partial [Funneliformis caledonium]